MHENGRIEQQQRRLSLEQHHHHTCFILCTYENAINNNNNKIQIMFKMFFFSIEHLCNIIMTCNLDEITYNNKRKHNTIHRIIILS